MKKITKLLVLVSIIELIAYLLIKNIDYTLPIFILSLPVLVFSLNFQFKVRANSVLAGTNGKVQYILIFLIPVINGFISCQWMFSILNLNNFGWGYSAGVGAILSIASLYKGIQMAE